MVSTKLSRLGAAGYHPVGSKGDVMTGVRVRVYYQYDGPSSVDPLRSELSNDEVTRNLKLLPNDLVHAFDEGTKIEVRRQNYEAKEIEISIQAECSRDEILEVVKNALRQSDLYGEAL